MALTYILGLYIEMELKRDIRLSNLPQQSPHINYIVILYLKIVICLYKGELI